MACCYATTTGIVSCKEYWPGRMLCDLFWRQHLYLWSTLHIGIAEGGRPTFERGGFTACWFHRCDSAAIESRWTKAGKGAAQKVDSVVAMALGTDRDPELLNPGFTNLGLFADPMSSPDLILESSQCEKGIIWNADKYGLELRIVDLTGDAALRNEKGLSHWRSIFNCAVLYVDKKDLNEGANVCLATKELLLKRVEDRESMQITSA